MSFYFGVSAQSARSIVVAAGIYFAVILAAVADPTGRNILFIAVDDLRPWVNYANDYEGTVHTPNIDALAAESTRYLSAYATVPQCVGSRASVMMGLSPATHHIDFASWGVEPTVQALYNNPSLLSLPQVLSQAGYHTATAGKVFHQPYPAKWDESGPTPVPVLNLYDPGPYNTFLNPEVLPDTEVHPDQIVANWAETFINSYTAENPFFLAIGLYQPHIPWRVPQWAYDLYPLAEVVTPMAIPGDLDDEPALAVSLARGQPAYPIFNGGGLYYDELISASGQAPAYTQAYLASISHTDAMVGQVLAALAASPFANNTDIILWSDHGYHLGEKYHWQKLTFWEQSVKVPLLVKASENPNYQVGDVNAPVSLLDLAPTVLDLAGLPPFPQFQGVPLRTGASSHSPVKIYLTVEGKRGRATVSAAHVKNIDYDLDTAQGSLDQARYNLLSDKNEEYNVWTPGC